ncbi:MAG: hypothetical protein H6Q90_5527 [Deltaproteobacteria bacterium]|nr:hypothetical protein [Deltaproteobacteria bacterium]
MDTNLSQLMTVTCGGDARIPESRSHQLVLTITALFAGLALSALWGLAAGSTSATLALANAYKVPMVILLSALTALPAGLVTLRLANAPLPAHQLVSAFVTSIFGGTLVLATLAPLVAIYYHTSSMAGVPIALGSVFVALATASLLFGRAVGRRMAGQPERRGTSLIAVGVLVALFLTALLQFVAMASPIIAATTRFDGGFDTVFSR